MSTHRGGCSEVFCKKGVLRKFAKFTGNTCARVSFLTKLFPYEFCEIYRTPPVAASVPMIIKDNDL